MKHSSFLPLLPVGLLCVAAAPAARADGDVPEPVKISDVDRSMFFRDRKGYVGNAGFNGGDWSKEVFNGTFTDYRYQNAAGAELVIDTTDPDTGAAYYVTSIKVGHKGNAKYSLYYTTEEAPDYSGYTLTDGDQGKSHYYNVASDSRHWTAVPGALGIQEAGTKTYGLNEVATAVKYVFDTTISWTVSLAEVEVWGVDPSLLSCQHPSYTEWVPIPGTATCTKNGVDQRECTVCGEVFQRESATILFFGHDYRSRLDSAGSGLRYGSGAIECSRHDFEIDCTNGPVDLVEYGGVRTDGIVQFTELSVSSTGDIDYGVCEDDLIDGDWTMGWGHYWYAHTSSTNEYVQFSFGTAIDLTAVEISVPNRIHTLRFSSVVDGEEVPIGEHVVEYASNGGGYRRMTVEFRDVTLTTLRIRSDDGSDKLTVSEVHPWGTVAGAGKTSAVRTRILID